MSCLSRKVILITQLVNLFESKVGKNYIPVTTCIDVFVLTKACIGFCYESQMGSVTYTGQC